MANSTTDPQRIPPSPARAVQDGGHASQQNKAPYFLAVPPTLSMLGQATLPNQFETQQITTEVTLSRSFHESWNLAVSRDILQAAHAVYQLLLAPGAGAAAVPCFIHVRRGDMLEKGAAGAVANGTTPEAVVAAVTSAQPRCTAVYVVLGPNGIDPGIYLVSKLKTELPLSAPNHI